MRAFCSGLTRAKTVVAAIAAARCVVVEGVEVGAGEHGAAPAGPRSRQTFAATTALSPVTTLTVMPRLGQPAQRRGGVGLGRVEEDQEAGSVEVVLVRRRSGARRSATGRVATATTRLPAANSRVQRGAGPPVGTSTQRSSTASGAPLVTSVTAAVGVADEDRDHPPLVVERQHAEHRVRGQRPSAPRPSAGDVPQRLVERVAADAPAPVRSRSRCTAAPAAARRRDRRPSAGDGAREADPPVGQRAGLVGEQHVDVAEVLDADQPLDQHLAAAHPPRPGGQAGRHDGRQQLRGDADGDGQGEQQRVEERPVQQRR